MKKILIYLTLFSVSCKNATDQKPSEKIMTWEFTEGVNLGEQKPSYNQSKIEISSGAETDFFIEPGATPYEKSNAPLLLKGIDNTKPFTFSFKVTPEHHVKYDAGMAFLWLDNTHWVKFAFEADEHMNKRIVTVRTNNFSDDNNHDRIDGPSVYMKISSDTKAIGFYYSVDGQQWQLVRVFKNEFPAALKLGIGSQSPAGHGNKSLFEEIQFKEKSITDFRTGV